MGKVSQLILLQIAGKENPLHALEIGPAKDQSPNTELFKGSFFNGTLFLLSHITNYLELRIFSFSLNYTFKYTKYRICNRILEGFY